MSAGAVNTRVERIWYKYFNDEANIAGKPIVLCCVPSNDDWELCAKLPFINNVWPRQYRIEFADFDVFFGSEDELG